MIHFMIHVYEASVYIRQCFDLILKVLRDIMRSPQWHLRRKNNVQFDKIIWPRMVNSTSIDFEDLGAESHGLRVVDLGGQKRTELR